MGQRDSTFFVSSKGRFGTSGENRPFVKGQIHPKKDQDNCSSSNCDNSFVGTGSFLETF